ncbi:hypothetical protein IV203_010532 [Nitzschia inconspicua]|uniref:Sulfotransferase n=1 Tax=Nitzschia inconspicua TaxID=303405 RepID=A0A9K3KXA4_9STRA|nr:hypothetical protein IV203_010532 [Nitzschia inconspicua]
MSVRESDERSVMSPSVDWALTNSRLSNTPVQQYIALASLFLITLLGFGTFSNKVTAANDALEVHQKHYNGSLITGVGGNTSTKVYIIEKEKESIPIFENNASITVTANTGGDNPTAHQSTLSIKEQQLQSYRDGTGLLLNVHVTHHGGTFFCFAMNQVGPCPKFACMGGDNWPKNTTLFAKAKVPWSFNDTGPFVQEARQYFHMISWEFGHWANLGQTNWHHPDLVSVAIMRHPLERFLAGGRCGGFQPKLTADLADDPGLSDVYWEYANAACADNYALKVFTGSSGCCNGTNTDVKYLDEAKHQLDQFTIIMDQDCLTESIYALFDLLHLNTTEALQKKAKSVHVHKSVRERIGNDTLYEYLEHHFRRDIELYEYVKSKSILDCSTLKRRA